MLSGAVEGFNQQLSSQPIPHLYSKARPGVPGCSQAGGAEAGDSPRQLLALQSQLLSCRLPPAER